MARYGGEEFALVLEGTDRTGARQLAERIRQEVGAQTHDSAKGAFRATLSLGVTVYPEDGKSKQELIANADQALYAAKHGGRNRGATASWRARRTSRRWRKRRGRGVTPTLDMVSSAAGNAGRTPRRRGHGPRASVGTSYSMLGHSNAQQRIARHHSTPPRQSLPSLVPTPAAR